MTHVVGLPPAPTCPTYCKMARQIVSGLLRVR